MAGVFDPSARTASEWMKGMLSSEQVIADMGIRLPARHARRRIRRERETLADWAVICDDLICSSQVGALKSEDPQAFFGPWLADHAVQFADALLIDDRADNCAAFTSQGGTAIQWKMGTNPTSELAASLRQWMTPFFQTR